MTQSFIAPDNVVECFVPQTNVLQQALGIISQRQVDYADLYFQLRVQESWLLENSIIRPSGFN